MTVYLLLVAGVFFANVAACCAVQNDVQLSSSCHQCQYQHIRWLCGHMDPVKRKEYVAMRDDEFVDAEAVSKAHGSYCSK